MEGDLQRLLGRNLRAIRLQRGLSQEGFALLLGIHRTYVGGLERGERNVSLKTVERLAEDLEVEPSSLLMEDPGRPDRTPAGRRHQERGQRQREPAAAR